MAVSKVVMPATATMAQAYQVHLVDSTRSHLSPTFVENLTLKTIPIPKPGPGQILLRIRAVSLNFRDLLVISGSPHYPLQTSNGLIPCSDGSGEIISTGAHSKWKENIGAAVILVLSPTWTDGDVVSYKFDDVPGAGTKNGTLSQYLVVDDDRVLLAPKNLNFEEAATVAGAGGTAINVLSSVIVGKKTTVLTQGTGGVSCFVIQFAATLGARVIATSSTAEKLEVAKYLGASELINYKASPDWAEEVVRLTNGKGVDLVADVGGSGTVEQSVKALRQGGTAALIGFLAPAPPVDLVHPLIVFAKTLRGVLGSSTKMLEQAVELIEDHDLHPYIGRVYEWEEAGLALEMLRKQEVSGKIVIRV